MKQIWKEGIMGVVIGDALGCPVQFKSREEVAANPVTGMRGYGTFNVPEGCWTDDSSLTLALMSSMLATGTIDLKHVMQNFVEWLDHGAFTPLGYAYDIGRGVQRAITMYKRRKNPYKCGGEDDFNNGNGSLMRIMPACLYCYVKGLSDKEAVGQIHLVGSLTHAHIRANMACGLYYFMVKAVLDETGTLMERLQKGLDQGFAFYETTLYDHDDLDAYRKLRNLAEFAKTPEEKISGKGYVVYTLEAVLWSLITTDSFEHALLRAVNLGEDTDTVAGIAGGLAALYYGYESIPEEWLQVIKRKAYIDEVLEKAEEHDWKAEASEGQKSE